MKSIALVIPYFGKKPSYFNVWKYSALKNKSVDFIFFTDIESISAEENIKVNKITFTDFVSLFKNKFDFEISLSAPYKLCDFKPTYGYVLEDYLKGYDFWGHCDVDLIFGDVRTFITEEILNSFDKILELGHFTLYKNTKENNKVFMACAGYKDYDYKKCLSCKDAMYFDEALGTRFIFDKQNVATYKNNNVFFDVLPDKKPFTHITEYFGESVFRYDDNLGKLYAVYKNGTSFTEKEIMYAHFQKRKMDYSQFESGKDFIIVPNKLISANVTSIDKLFKVNGKRIYKLKRKALHVKDFLSRYKKSGIKSFKAYRKSRKDFRLDLINAKKLLKGDDND